MKHIHLVSKKAERAQDVTIGQKLVVIAQILAVIGQALVAKDEIPA